MASGTMPRKNQTHQQIQLIVFCGVLFFVFILNSEKKYFYLGQISIDNVLVIVSDGLLILFFG